MTSEYDSREKEYIEVIAHLRHLNKDAIKEIEKNQMRSAFQRLLFIGCRNTQTAHPSLVYFITRATKEYDQKIV